MSSPTDGWIVQQFANFSILHWSAACWIKHFSHWSAWKKERWVACSYSLLVVCCLSIICHSAFKLNFSFLAKLSAFIHQSITRRFKLGSERFFYGFMCVKTLNSIHWPTDDDVLIIYLFSSLKPPSDRWWINSRLQSFSINSTSCSSSLFFSLGTQTMTVTKDEWLIFDVMCARRGLWV